MNDYAAFRFPSALMGAGRLHCHFEAADDNEALRFWALLLEQSSVHPRDALFQRGRWTDTGYERLNPRLLATPRLSPTLTIRKLYDQVEEPGA